MNPNLEIRVTVILPHDKKRLCAAVQVSEHIYAESFAPLPRERELPFAVEAQRQAQRQQQMRRHIARSLGEELATKILELIEREDPQHGYSPEEWARLNQP